MMGGVCQSKLIYYIKISFQLTELTFYRSTSVKTNILDATTVRKKKHNATIFRILSQ